MFEMICEVEELFLCGPHLFVNNASDVSLRKSLSFCGYPEEKLSIPGSIFPPMRR